MDKVKVFEGLLNKFETDEIRNYCADMINEIPDYIFIIPSSTSFKYHNKTQCQPHGQIFHILMFAEVMNYVLGLEYVKEKTNERQRDCLRCTPIFHDAIKCGLNGSQYTVHEHPMLAGEWVRNTSVEHDVDADTKAYIARLCESHSGEWTSTKRSKTVLPKPENDEQFFVHMCDYCNYDSSNNRIYIDSLTNDYYMEVETSEWDQYDDGYVRQRIYIDYCPWCCGRKLSNKKRRTNCGSTSSPKIL